MNKQQKEECMKSRKFTIKMTKKGKVIKRNQFYKFDKLDNINSRSSKVGTAEDKAFKESNKEDDSENYIFSKEEDACNTEKVTLQEI